MLTLEYEMWLLVQDPYHICCFYKHKKFVLIVGFGRAALTRLFWIALAVSLLLSVMIYKVYRLEQFRAKFHLLRRMSTFVTL